MEDWEGDVIVSRSTDLERLTGGAWTNSWWTATGQLNQTALTATIYHPIKKIFDGSLLVGDDRYVHRIIKNDQGSIVVNYKRLILPTGYRVHWIRSTSGFAWIGANHIRSDEAAVFYWDGQSENYNSPSPFGLNHPTAFCGVVKDDTLHVINGLGQLLKFTGAGFREIARFPTVQGGIYDDDGMTNIVLDDGSTPLGNIHPNGIDVVDDHIHVLVNAEISNAANRVLENFVSGIYVYDGADEEGERGSLIHRYSLSQTKSGDTQVDYGIQGINVAGFLRATFDSNRLVCGAGIWTDNVSTERKAIFQIIVLPTGNRGYFITTRFPVSEIEDLWDKIYLKFRKLGDVDDRIIIKYRTDEDHALDFRSAITWTAGNTFTSTDANISDVADGDEVEVIAGQNAGAVAHVSGAPSLAGSTYTVTLDETLVGTSGTARVRFRGWTKLRTISDTTIRNQFDVIGKDSQWIQFKIEMRADMNTGGSIGIAIEEMIVNSTPSKLING